MFGWNSQNWSPDGRDIKWLEDHRESQTQYVCHFPELEHLGEGPNALNQDPKHVQQDPEPLSKDSDVEWYKQACVEAVVDRGAAMLTKTSTVHHGFHAMKAVVVRSDRLWANGTVCLPFAVLLRKVAYEKCFVLRC